MSGLDCFCRISVSKPLFQHQRRPVKWVVSSVLRWHWAFLVAGCRLSHKPAGELLCEVSVTAPLVKQSIVYVWGVSGCKHVRPFLQSSLCWNKSAAGDSCRPLFWFGTTLVLLLPTGQQLCLTHVCTHWNSHCVFFCLSELYKHTSPWGSCVVDF